MHTLFHKGKGILSGAIMLGVVLCHAPCLAQSDGGSLWLSPAPSSGRPTGAAGGHDHGGSPSTAPKERPGTSHDHGGPSATVPKGRPGSGHDTPSMLESEHRPSPMRSYLLHDRHCHGEINAVVRRPDGTVEPASVKGDVVSFKAPMGDGPAHGGNNLYVIEKWLENDTLVIRVAKWITMHHSCGWGHDHKFNEQRINPQGLSDIPFEIIPGKLWDTNFHSSLRSGDSLPLQVMSEGKPAANAELMVRTGQGWSKKFSANQDGTVTLQVINDYIPSKWPEFKRTHRTPLMLTASYTASESGMYKEQPYNKVRYTTTLPWHYQPAQAQYSSYGYGLGIGTFTMLISGLGIYSYRSKRRRPTLGKRQ